MDRHLQPRALLMARALVDRDRGRPVEHVGAAGPRHHQIRAGARRVLLGDSFAVVRTSYGAISLVSV